MWVSIEVVAVVAIVAVIPANVRGVLLVLSQLLTGDGIVHLSDEEPLAGVLPEGMRGR